MDNRGLKKLLNKQNGVIETPLSYNSNNRFSTHRNEIKRKFFFKYTYYYLVRNDTLPYVVNNYRIEYGYHFKQSGISYQLQKLNSKKKWKTINWTYPETHNYNINSVIDYLTFSLR